MLQWTFSPIHLCVHVCAYTPDKFLASELRDSNAIYFQFPCDASSLPLHQSCPTVLVCRGLSANFAV